MINAISEIGSRETNEDAFWFCEESPAIYLVADGCGGYQHGEVASEFVIEYLSSLLQEEPLSEDYIKNCILRANVSLLEKQKACAGMKTTIVGLVFDKERAWAFNVGDSRLFQIRDGKCIFNTEDHSVPYLLYKAGIIEKDEINTHEDRNKLLEALGNKDKIKVNVYEIDKNKDDLFLLASDGFWENISEDDFLSLSRQNMEEWLETIKVKIIDKNDCEQDNYTALVVRG